ncbi:GGDEF domain-containing protein [Camelimonas abortus]|uniref:GGDEF domain-containing protein n=1 Tax=Camelimonas abortus TaxID=1017184 RepID=A0ABV7LCP0_9HYPH
MLDMPTIIIATYCTAIVQGCLLLFFWLGDRARPALGLGGGAFVAFGGGFALLGAGSTLGLEASAGLGGGLVALSGSLFVAAARRIGGRHAPLGLIAAPPVLWAAACAWRPFVGDAALVACALSAYMSACFLLCAVECWRWSSQMDGPRRPLAAAALAFSLLFALRAVYNAALPFPLGSGDTDAAVWHALAALVVFALLSMVAFLAVSTSHGQRDPARESPAIVDAETGALRRGAFLIQGARIVARHHDEGRQACLALVSLATSGGREKGEALRLFARVAGGVLKPTDLFARMGDATFALLVSDVASGEGEDIAGELCARFVRAASAAGLDALARAGIVSSTQAGGDLRAMIVAAEQALQHARFAGAPIVRYHPGLAARDSGAVENLGIRQTA